IAGARGFIAAKQPADELSVISFGSSATTLAPFSTVKLDADSPIAHLRTDRVRGTALYDAIIMAARQLGGNPLPGRAMIVLIVGAGSTTELSQIPPGDMIQAPEPSKLVPKNAYGPGGPLAIAIAVAALVLFACLFFLTGIRGSWVRSRIAPHTGEAKGNSKQKRKERRSEMFASVFAASERAFGNLKQWRAISRMLERADVQLRTVAFVWIALRSAVVVAGRSLRV